MRFWLLVEDKVRYCSTSMVSLSVQNPLPYSFHGNRKHKDLHEQVLTTVTRNTFLLPAPLLVQ